MRLTSFFKQCILAPKTTGAIAPSSRALGLRVAEAAGVATANAVVEFGPGTGVLTEVILEKLKKDAVFFTVEINEEFVEILRKRFPTLTVFHDSAAHTRRYLDQLGLDGCDCIVSGLPWSLFEDALQDQLLDTVVDVLRPGGRFVTFMYVISPLCPRGKRFKRKLYERFERVQRTSSVWRNFPPAFAYCATKHETS